LERKEEKQMLFESFENAPAMSIEPAISQAERFALVNAFGHYDAKRHILLDNKILNGRAGVHVLTPFHLTDGTVLLVNRGWLPMPADRLSLPAVPTDSSPQTITGRLNGLPTEGVRVGAADVLTTDDWPQLVTYLDQKPIESALDEILSGWIIQLDAGDPSGFDGRQWTPAVMEPAVHGAYAFSVVFTIDCHNRLLGGFDRHFSAIHFAAGPGVANVHRDHWIQARRLPVSLPGSNLRSTAGSQGFRARPAPYPDCPVASGCRPV
jgi:surfeit locus 1 family protein